jgi:putative thioredoxin
MVRPVQGADAGAGKGRGEYADKGVVLAKVNVDEEQFIAAQFQVRSIPTVYAIFQGQPVADLTSARSESQLKADARPAAGASCRCSRAAPRRRQADSRQLVAMGERCWPRAMPSAPRHLQADRRDGARQCRGPFRADPRAGRRRRLDEAQAAWTDLPDELRADPAVAQARQRARARRHAVDDSELQALRAAPPPSARRHGGAVRLRQAAFAAGERDEAADTLLQMIERRPEWNEGAARAKLLQIFEAVGLEDPWVAAQRRGCR